jgi:biotin synthase
MEACVTLGMLTEEQTEQLHEAGLTAYNHNLDTSESYYPNIISTRSYQDRLDTLENVRGHGIHVCSGGIVGMGEARADRAEMLRTLAALDPHPESVPVNMLERVDGTPLAEADDTDPFEVVRTVAAARILMPLSRVRLSAGRRSLTREAQALCFMAGANSIFFGERLLTSGNPAIEADESLFRDLGMETG